MSALDVKAPRRISLIVWISLCILVLAVIASLWLPMGRISAQSYGNKMKHDVRRLISLLKDYAGRHEGRFPDNLQALLGIHYQSLDIMKIDLMDGKPQQHWIYYRGLSDKVSDAEWVVFSPPLVNDKLSAKERQQRIRKGQEPPPDRPWRVLAKKNGTVEYMPETDFQEIAKRENIFLSDASIDAKSK